MNPRPLFLSGSLALFACGGTTPAAPVAAPRLPDPAASIGARLAASPDAVTYVLLRPGTEVAHEGDPENVVGELVEGLYARVIDADGERVRVAIEPREDEGAPFRCGQSLVSPGLPVRMGLTVPISALTPLLAEPLDLVSTGGGRVEGVAGTPVAIEGTTVVLDDGEFHAMLTGQAAASARLGYAFSCGLAGCPATTAGSNGEYTCEVAHEVAFSAGPGMNVHVLWSSIFHDDDGRPTVVGASACVSAAADEGERAAIACLTAVGSEEGGGEPGASDGSMDAVGGLIGSSVGDSGGAGGLGLMGTGLGGGGTGMGIGIGTLGSGSGDGDPSSGYGMAASMGDVRGPHPVVRDAGPPEVEGGLSTDQVRRVVRRNVSQVAHCYEQELRSDPDLAGTFVVDFVISATGSVAEARGSTDEPALGDLAACGARAVMRWTFPQPDPEGLVRVRYRFRVSMAGDAVSLVHVPVGTSLVTDAGVPVGSATRAFDAPRSTAEGVGTRSCFELAVPGIAFRRGAILACVSP